METNIQNNIESPAAGNLQTMEKQMHQQISQYVQLVDLFETQLNDRTATWRKRKASREFRAKASKKLISMIVSGAIALFAIITIISMLITR